MPPIFANFHSLCVRYERNRRFYSPSRPVHESHGRTYPLILLVGSIFIVVFLGTGLIALSKPIDVVSNGRTEYVIVRSREAPAPEQFAAQELQKYLRQITGVELPIVDEGGRQKAFLIGQAAGPKNELNGKS